MKIKSFEKWCDVLEAKRCNESCNGADDQRAERLNALISDCAYGNSTCESSVLNVHHVESLSAQESGADDGGYGGADDGEKCVDDGAGLAFVFGDGRVEGWLDFESYVESLAY